MVRQQRYALFNGIVALSALVLFAALVPVMGQSRAQCAFGLLAVCALGPVLYRRRAGQITGDERDRAIHLRATPITFGILWLLFIAAMGISYFFQYGLSGDRLILVIWLGTAALLLCQSAVLLVLYRRS